MTNCQVFFCLIKSRENDWTTLYHCTIGNDTSNFSTDINATINGQKVWGVIAEEIKNKPSNCSGVRGIKHFRKHFYQKTINFRLWKQWLSFITPLCRWLFSDKSMIVCFIPDLLTPSRLYLLLVCPCEDNRNRDEPERWMGCGWGRKLSFCSLRADFALQPHEVSNLEVYFIEVTVLSTCADDSMDHSVSSSSITTKEKVNAKWQPSDHPPLFTASASPALSGLLLPQTRLLYASFWTHRYSVLL